MHGDALDVRVHGVSVYSYLREHCVAAGGKLAGKDHLKRRIFGRSGGAREHDVALGVEHHVAALRCSPLPYVG